MSRGIYVRTEEIRKKNSVSNKRQIPWNKGLTKEIDMRLKNEFAGKYTRTDKIRKKQSAANKGLFKGEKNPMFGRIGERAPQWKGGITKICERIRHSFKYAQWRIAIFKRDDYTCQCCGKRGVYIEAHHHLKGFSNILLENHVDSIEKALDCKELWDMDLGQTLCKKCHKKEHAKPKIKIQKSTENKMLIGEML